MPVARVAKARVGWTKRAPKTRQARRAVKAKCGDGCFLEPRGDNDAGSFPICRKVTKRTKKCVVDCQGIESAYKRARQHGHTVIAHRALAAGKKAKCGWYARNH